MACGTGACVERVCGHGALLKGGRVRVRGGARGAVHAACEACLRGDGGDLRHPERVVGICVCDAAR